MTSQFLITMTGMALLVAVVGWMLLLAGNQTALAVIRFGLFAAQLSAMCYFLQKTTFLNSYFWVFTLAGFILILVGSMFKVMHWPSATLLLMTGAGTCALSYMLHFLRKNQKFLPDILKLAWVLVSAAVFALTQVHLLPKETYILPPVLLMPVFLVVLREEQYGNREVLTEKKTDD